MRKEKCPFCGMGQDKRRIIYSFTKGKSKSDLIKLRRRIKEEDLNKKYKNYVA